MLDIDENPAMDFRDLVMKLADFDWAANIVDKTPIDCHANDMVNKFSAWYSIIDAMTSSEHITVIGIGNLLWCQTDISAHQPTTRQTIVIIIILTFVSSGVGICISWSVSITEHSFSWRLTKYQIPRKSILWILTNPQIAFQPSGAFWG